MMLDQVFVVIICLFLTNCNYYYLKTKGFGSWKLLLGWWLMSVDTVEYLFSLSIFLSKLYLPTFIWPVQIFINKYATTIFEIMRTTN